MDCHGSKDLSYGMLQEKFKLTIKLSILEWCFLNFNQSINVTQYSLFSYSWENQMWAFGNIKVERLGWIVAKIRLQMHTPPHGDCWIKTPNRRADWNWLSLV
jgi:hypothetical protein